MVSRLVGLQSNNHFVCSCYQFLALVLASVPAVYKKNRNFDSVWHVGALLLELPY